MHEGVRALLARLRREAKRRGQITEPPAPVCPECGYSLAQAVIVKSYRGERECEACAEARRDYHRERRGALAVSVIKITESASREEFEEARRRGFVDDS